MQDPWLGGAAVNGHSVWFSIHGRNKLSVTRDLKRQRDIALRLAARADALVENLRAGQLERLGLGPEVLWRSNPRLVIGRISGYGQDGPYRDKPAFGAIGEAMGGIRHLTGYPPGSTDLPPPRCGISISDDLAGLYAAIGVLAAVWQRDATGAGTGRVVDVNLSQARPQCFHIFHASCRGCCRPAAAGRDSREIGCAAGMACLRTGLPELRVVQHGNRQIVRTRRGDGCQ
jgi:crotonobetainyl-CoA:carnitine CoA-transferase CaiB-like acyl-CoA transferase